MAMFATLLSRVSGLAREVVTAAVFGAGATMAAFTVAFQIPNIVRSAIADVALTSALVPVFTELVERDEEARAWRVASTMVSLILLALIPLTLLGMWAAPYIVNFAVHDDFSQVELAVTLFRIMLPLVLLMALAGVVIGILNAYGHFSVPALAPVAWNGVVIVMVLAATRLVDASHVIHVYAAAVVVGTIVQLLLPVPWLHRKGNRLGAAFDLRDPHVKAIVTGMLPVVVSLLLIDINTLVNMYFSTRIPAELVSRDTGPAVLDKAFRVFQLPQGIFSLAVAGVFFPLFARFSAREDTQGFRTACADALRQLFVLLLPAAALMFALAEPIVRVLYQRGAWDPGQTPVVAQALRMFALGLVANGAILLLMRAFFSLRTPWVPAITGFLNFGSNVVFAVLLHRRFGTWGIALSASLANTITFAAMYVVLHRRLGGLPGVRLMAEFSRAMGASVSATAAGWALAYATMRSIGHSAIAELLAISIAVAATYGIYIGLVVRLELMDGSALRALLRRRVYVADE